MNIVTRSAVVVGLVLFAATGCAPKNDGVEGEGGLPTTAEPGASAPPVPAAAATSTTAPTEPAAIAGKQVAFLGKTVDIPFEHNQVYDRVRPDANGADERQIGLTSTETDHKALAASLDAALKAAGFESRSAENKDGWVWLTVTGDAGRAKIAVRPEKDKPGTVIVFKVPKA